MPICTILLKETPLSSVSYLSEPDRYSFFNIGLLSGTKSIVLLCLFCLSSEIGGSQSLDYKDIFVKDWGKAEIFLNENHEWIKATLEKFDVPYKETISVVFPELVRYSALQDKIEITLLKALYINLGEDYANFSIGSFQMKPTFAEKIREAADNFPEFKNREYLKSLSSFDDIKTYRASIIQDLEKPETEILYLIIFIKTCEKQFSLKKMKINDKIKFLAAAYNFGFWKTKGQIDSVINKKYFRTSLAGTVKYSYADVSLFWYNNSSDE